MKMANYQFSAEKTIWLPVTAALHLTNNKFNKLIKYLHKSTMMFLS